MPQTEWNDLEDRILWAEANRDDLGPAEYESYVTERIFKSQSTYVLVRETVLGKPGAEEAMEVRRGTPAPTSR